MKEGNPKQVRGLEDLTRPDVRMVNREKGAGARLLLDHLLSRHRIPSQIVRGYGAIAVSQIGLGRCISEGKADVGIGAQAVAQLYNFDFIPLQEERYDLSHSDGVRRLASRDEDISGHFGYAQVSTGN